MNRLAFQNSRVGVLRMGFRARKPFGTFEKRAADGDWNHDLLCRTCAVLHKLSSPDYWELNFFRSSLATALVAFKLQSCHQPCLTWHQFTCEATQWFMLAMITCLWWPTLSLIIKGMNLVWIWVFTHEPFMLSSLLRLRRPFLCSRVFFSILPFHFWFHKGMF